MKLYVVTRWGNPHEAGGPDEADTNFLVRAASVKGAAALVDAALLDMPVQIGRNRPVQGFAHFITQVGVDADAKAEAVMHGPWIKPIRLDESEHCPAWYRDTKRGRWKAKAEIFPENF